MTRATQASSHPSGVQISAPPVAGQAEVLTPQAVGFIADLGREFTPRLHALLAARRQVQARLDRGERFDFLAETREVREAAWAGASIPGDLLDRRVEITGPVDRKMIINALNSGANV